MMLNHPHPSTPCPKPAPEMARPAGHVHPRRPTAIRFGCEMIAFGIAAASIILLASIF